MSNGKTILEAMRVEHDTHRSIGNACWESLENMDHNDESDEMAFVREYFLIWRDCHKTRIATYIKMINAAAEYYPGIFKGTQVLAETKRLAAVTTTRINRSRKHASLK